MCVVFVLLVALGFAEGGLLPRTWRLASIALLVFAAAALVAVERIALSRLEVAALVALGALVLWTALSAAWSSRPTASLLQGERVLVYAAALLVFLLLIDVAAVRGVLTGVLAAASLVCAYALVRRLVAPPSLDRFEGRLLYQPYGYANALGIVAAIGILLALGLTLGGGSPLQRALAVAPLLVLVPALVLTSSRGAGVALVAGLGVLVASRGRAFAAAVGAVVFAGAVIAAAAALSGHGLGRVVGDRGSYWHVAVEDSRAHPLVGSGAGTYGDYWLRHRPVSTFTRTAHSIYLESLAELGAVGLALVVAALGLPLLVLRRGRDPLLAAAAAGWVAYLVHAGVDFDWELPGVTLVGLVCAAALLRAGSGSRYGLARRVRPLLLASVLALATVEVVRLASGPATPFGY